MKKYLPILVALLCVISISNAQIISVTSPNGSTILCSTLNEAYDKAKNDDIIQLPAGYFRLDKSIDKKIHIIGVGYDESVSGGNGVTRIDGIKLHRGASGSSLQGVECTGVGFADPTQFVVDGFLVKRCKLKEFRFSGYGQAHSLNTLIQECVFYDDLNEWLPADFGRNTKVENCIFYVKGKIGSAPPAVLTRLEVSSAVISNSIIMNIDTTSDVEKRAYPLICPNNANVTFENNIFIGNVDGGFCKFANNIIIGKFKINEKNRYGKDLNNKFMTASDVFIKFNEKEDFNFFNNDFHLTEKAKKAIIPQDGTEVGIYGGNYPFKALPVTPQINKAKVNSKTNAKGQIQIDFEVDAQQN